MRPNVSGIHHISAISTDPQRTVDFYAGTLGLRLVKQTVNFDDPRTYHLYFGDESGTPGTVITFFPWPDGRAGRVGPGQVAVTSFAVRPEATAFWVQRLLAHRIDYEMPVRRTFGGAQETVLAFRDPDGLMLEIVAHPGSDSLPHRDVSDGIPEEDAIRGFHGATLWVESEASTARVLVDTLGYVAAGEHQGVTRFSAPDRQGSTFVDLRVTGDFPRGTQGTGTVHHIAFRVPDSEAQLALRHDAERAGLNPTLQIDRKYFRSVYFREPGGVLFEVATDTPGFAVDEPSDSLGRSLMLPLQYEARRAQIEAALPAIHITRDSDGKGLLGMVNFGIE